MKTLLLRTPIRDTPTGYPPSGSMAVMQALRQKGHEFSFLDLDVHRPTEQQIKQKVLDENPGIIGISAVVSTAYRYVKDLVKLVKSVKPDAVIIVGGGLAWNSRLLLDRAEVDYCVVGEGLVTAQELIGKLVECGRKLTDEEAKPILGMSFKTKSGQNLFTGFRPQVNLMEQEMEDYSLIDFDHFVFDPIHEKRDSGWLLFPQDERAYEPHRKGQKIITLVTSKGCVARCTFCHRMEKGIRIKEIDRIVSEVQRAKDLYNAGFIFFGDEDFGASKKWVDEFCKRIKPLDILFAVQGMRVSHTTPENLKALKDAGCVSIFFGIESGSQKMLNVMQKSTTLEQNINACKWVVEAGILPSYQFVLAMPGETNETVQETLDFIKTVTQDLPSRDKIRVSAKYLMILPSTPVYEYAARKGFIGATVDDEEEYLLSISDHEPDKFNPGFINLTDSDYYTVANWEKRIHWEPWIHWNDHNKAPHRSLISTLITATRPGGLSELSRERNKWIYLAMMTFLNLPYHVFTDLRRGVALKTVTRRIWDWANFRVKRFISSHKQTFEYVSIRKNSTMKTKDPYDQDDSMKLVRAGR